MNQVAAAVIEGTAGKEFCARCDDDGMLPPIDVDDLLSQAAALLRTSFREWHRPAAGADHLVVLVTTATGDRLVLKAGAGADVDAHVLSLLAGSGAKIPTLLGRAPLRAQPHAGSLIVMTAAEGTLLADVVEQSDRYLRPLIDEMRKVHAVTTTVGAGPVLAVERGALPSWRGYLLSVLTGRDPEFRWAEIARHAEVDGHLLVKALEAAAARAQDITFPPTLSLLHGDLNPYNVFVRDGEITGIIDWSYARYGDPLFDFARLRMNPFVRSSPTALRAFRSLLDLTPEEAADETFYYRFNLLEYVNWYFLQGQLARVQEQLALIKAEVEGKRVRE